jgi:hypothetical protein
MSNEYYRQHSGHIFWIIEGIFFALACVVDGVIGIYLDSIAGSFDRSPQAVVPR